MFLGVVRVGAVLATIGAMAAPAAASPSTGPALFLGPLRVRHGYQLRIAELNCAKHGSLVQIDFAKHHPWADEGHGVAPVKSRCRAARGLWSTGSCVATAQSGTFVGHRRWWTRPRARPGPRWR